MTNTVNDIGKTRRRAVQERTLLTRSKIADGAIQVLAHAGVAGLTHRAVATAAGVSLAATTHHFDTKADIIDEASRVLLEGYLTAFRRMKARMDAGDETRLASLDDLVNRVVRNALGCERVRSLAWCELVLHGGRSPAGRLMAQNWYAALDQIWFDIARHFDPAAAHPSAGIAIDLVVGMTFMLHPLGLDQITTDKLLADTSDIERILDQTSRGVTRAVVSESDERAESRRHAVMRRKVLHAAIDVIVADGAANVSYSRVAEVAGMVRSGPSYYYPTINGLLEAAELALFDRAKTRYRSGLAAHLAADIDRDRLLDLTTAVFFREALEFGRENIGFYSVWMNAAHNPSLRPAVAASLLDQHRAWTRRLTTAFGRAPIWTEPFRAQALFIGRLVRTIVAATEAADLARVRADFATVLGVGD